MNYETVRYYEFAHLVSSAAAIKDKFPQQMTVAAAFIEVTLGNPERLGQCVVLTGDNESQQFLLKASALAPALASEDLIRRFIRNGDHQALPDELSEADKTSWEKRNGVSLHPVTAAVYALAAKEYRKGFTADRWAESTRLVLELCKRKRYVDLRDVVCTVRVGSALRKAKARIKQLDLEENTDYLQRRADVMAKAKWEARARRLSAHPAPLPSSPRAPQWQPDRAVHGNR